MNIFSLQLITDHFPGILVGYQTSNEILVQLSSMLVRHLVKSGGQNPGHTSGSVVQVMFHQHTWDSNTRRLATRYMSKHCPQIIL